jgi:hypothetical protein
LDEPTKVETMPDPMSYKLEKVARFFDLLVKLVDLI